jgi:hypothetical protein
MEVKSHQAADGIRGKRKSIAHSQYSADAIGGFMDSMLASVNRTYRLQRSVGFVLLRSVCTSVGGWLQ